VSSNSNVSLKGRFVRLWLSAIIIGGISAGAIAVPPVAGAANVALHQEGGSITAPGAWSTLDPGSSLFTIGTSGVGIQIYDTLFAVPALPKGTRSTNNFPGAELAMSATYSNSFRTLTIGLRHGVIFQDNTPFNAQAVVFNLDRDMSGTDVSAPYLSTISSITAKGQYTVVIHSRIPDSNLLSALEWEPDELMVSPTAVSTEGLQQFGIMPVGAGPFKVVSDSVSSTLQLQSWPGYWNAKHRYLSSITFEEGPFVGGDAVEYPDLESGAINDFVEIGGPATPSVETSALDNSSITHMVSSDLGYHFLMLNTFTSPFNNSVAREALAYCTNRTAIATDVLAGLAKPAYVLSAPSQLYFPAGGDSASIYPYQTNFSKAQSLVQSLPGGTLSFNFIVGTSASSQLVPTALQQEWAQCGIHANLQPESTTAMTQARVNGTMQVWYETNGGTPNPYPALSLFTLSSSGSYNANGVFGYNDPTITSLVQSTGNTLSGPALTVRYTKIYAAVNKLAAIIPVWTAPNVIFVSSNLKGVQYQELNPIFANAYFS
jgi:peptide/nickel transport system substrate-binding protein